jgi:hypothetical protein
MPNSLAFNVAVPDWKEILAAAIEHAAILPDLTFERTALGGFIEQAETLRVRQLSLTATRQATTQELNNVIRAGQEVARHMRDAAKFKLGQRNEQIVQFKVAPLRKRPRKAATPEKPAPETARPKTPEVAEP